MILGRTGFARKGEWIAAVTYDALDIVTHEGKVYIGRRESVGSEPSSESNDWVMLPGAPSFEIEETASGYDLTITGSDGTSETISILNGEVDREELEDALEAFRSSTDAYLAPDYDDTATYSAGDSCIYEGRLYRCVEDIPTAEPWTAEHWEPVVLSNKVAQMRKDAVVKADIITSSASGEIVTIADGGNDLPVVDLSVSLLPVQDLHGQSSPYPPGGGANLLPMPITSGSYAYTAVITVNDDLSFYITKTSGSGWASFVLGEFTLKAGTYTLIESDDGSGNAAMSIRNTGTGSDITNTRYSKRRTFTLEEDTEVRVTYSRAATADNVLTKVMLFSGDTATADDYAPYSNICPISGWTGVDITRVGTNLLNPNLVLDQASWNYVSMRLNPNTMYTVSANYPNDGVLLMYAYNSSGRNSSSQVYSGKSVIVTTNADGELRLQQRRSDTTKSFADYITQVESGSSASELERYKEQTYPISWQSEAGTVYGGSLDVITGVLTVDKGIITFNGSETWYDYPSFEGYYVSLRTMKRGMRQDGASNMLKDSKSAAYGQTNSMWLGIDSRYFFAIGVYDSMGDTLLSFKEYLADHPLQIVYPLETPLVFQLDPVQISTLLGSNSFWSNGNGVVDLEYRCDTKLYIEQLTKPTEDDMVANSNIPANTYFTIGNALYLSTAAITAGEKIEPDTNCTRKSLADALNDLHD